MKRLIIPVALILMVFIPPMYVRWEEEKALHNISINKSIEFDFATADFYKDLCLERDLNTKTCQDAEKSLNDYIFHPEKVKILGY